MRNGYQCPVCGKKSDTLLCEGCGFDGSQDWERFPTLQPVPHGVKAGTALKQARPNQLDNKKCMCCGSQNTNGVCDYCGFEQGEELPSDVGTFLKNRVPHIEYQNIKLH